MWEIEDARVLDAAFKNEYHFKDEIILINYGFP